MVCLQERARLRDEINTSAMFRLAKELEPHQLITDLHPADFIIARVIWDREQHSYHDHFAFVHDK
jgi:hypothetical protein